MPTCPLKPRTSAVLKFVFISAAIYALSTAAARADTIVSVAGTDDGGDLLGANSQVLEVGFTTSAAYQNVTIDATLAVIPQPDPTVTAYLTTQIGSSATPASEVTTPTVLSLSGDTTATYTLISLPNLAAGTYYLVLSGDPDDEVLRWEYTNSPVVTTGSGDSLGSNGVANGGNSNTIYPPASIFAPEADNLLFEVDGTALTAVPEPSPLALLVILGLCGAGAKRAAKFPV
ncbi:MAG TPA: hypothetical protein VME17_23875 [Bryobacteraceae bacterium]|nr:hypothetical protein [Bryobacteraceae bacterium]